MARLINLAEWHYESNLTSENQKAKVRAAQAKYTILSIVYL